MASGLIILIIHALNMFLLNNNRLNKEREVIKDEADFHARRNIRNEEVIPMTPKMICKYCEGSVNQIKRLPFKSRKTLDRYKFYECENCGTAWAELRSEFLKNPPRLVHKGKILWKCVVPESFPCFLCRVGRADWSVHIGQGPILIKLVLCVSCANLPVVDIVARGCGGGVR